MYHLLQFTQCLEWICWRFLDRYLKMKSILITGRANKRGFKYSNLHVVCMMQQLVVHIIALISTKENTCLSSSREFQGNSNPRPFASKVKATPICYSSLMTNIQNLHTWGQDAYPTNLTMAHNMLVNDIQPHWSSQSETQDLSFY
jgi:hypothetical protein